MLLDENLAWNKIKMMKKIWLIGLIILTAGLWSNSSFSEISTLPNNELKRPSEFEKIFNYGLQLNKNIKEGPIRKEFETEEDFEKRKTIFIKEQISLKKDFEQTIYRTTLLYTKEKYSSPPLTFSLSEYDIKEEGFPIPQRFTWKKGAFSSLDAWETSDLKKYSHSMKYLLVFENMPTLLFVPIEIAKEIRKNEKNLKLELNFRIVSCEKKERYGSTYDSIGGGYVGGQYVPPVKVETGTRDTTESIIKAHLLSAILSTRREVYWEGEE